MGFFGRLFGKKSIAPAFTPAGDGPPDFAKAVELQRAYWTHNAVEQAALESQGIASLDWQQRLRLHHLVCLDRLKSDSDKIEHTLPLMLAPESPYRPRPGLIWQGKSAQPNDDRKPDMQGEFFNPSLTHLGCLEIIRIDAGNQPLSLDFVPFDDLSLIMFATPSMFRMAKLFSLDGQGEIVLVPLLYGITWEIGNEHDRSGQMTRFLSHYVSDKIATPGATGIGIGQQDFAIEGQDGGVRIFGIASVAEIAFPLDMRDLRFDEKCRARGIDPDDARRRMG